MRDLDFVRGRLEVHATMIEVDGYMEESTPKDYEERSIPVPEFILEQLTIHVEEKRPNDHVFVSSKSGTVLRNRTFRRGWFNAAAEEIGIPGLTPDEMRHTCASLAVSAGANVKVLQRMLGQLREGGPWTPTAICSTKTWTAWPLPSTPPGQPLMWAKCGRSDQQRVARQPKGRKSGC